MVAAAFQELHRHRISTSNGTYLRPTLQRWNGHQMALPCRL
jgi:hypothetical protein